MADNIDVTPGTGKTIAADLITIDGASALVQRVKPVFGAAGSGADADIGAGTGGSATQRVIVDSSQLATVATASSAYAAGVQPVALPTDQAWGVGAAGFTKLEDAASADGDKGIPAMAIRQATPADTSGTDGDYEMLRIKDGRIYARVTLDAGATSTVTQSASSTITRPADTTAYASGDLVANSTTAGSVTNLQFTTLARVSGGSGVIVGAQIQKSSATATNAAFRLHLFNTAPTYTSAGDNSALSTVVVASAKGYLGYIDITTMVGFSDVCWGSGAPDNSRGSIPYVATAQIIYGLLEARGAYTPTSAEVFTVVLDALQD